MISDAANIVSVESHVLRYWEDELELHIPRNELGHRYYTKENIDEFMRIKKLKEQGYQLKAIKMILQNEKQKCSHSGTDLAIRIEKVDGKKIGEEEIYNQMEKNEVVTVTQETKQLNQIQEDRAKRMEQFQSMMTEIVKKAISENNQELGQAVGVQVGEHVIKEMNYLMRTQEEQEEERFRKLDEAIRNAGKKKTWRKTRQKEGISRKEKRQLKKQNAFASDV